tara:strand:- start:1120 stop:1728 length:609 start_codon:yes stop_codon:yes gene_type:complete
VSLSKNKAIVDLLGDQSLKDLAQKLTSEYAEDLIQEVALLLLEMSEEKWDEINKGGYLRFYVVRTIITMGTSPRSSFARKYELFQNKGEITELADEPNTSDEKEKLFNELEKALDGLYWYDAEILKAYVNEGSYRKVQQKTGIPFRSVGNTVKKVIEQIKKEIYGNTNSGNSGYRIGGGACRTNDDRCEYKKTVQNIKKRKP